MSKKQIIFTARKRFEFILFILHAEQEYLLSCSDQFVFTEAQKKNEETKEVEGEKIRSS